jgi:hypothetical protein
MLALGTNSILQQPVCNRRFYPSAPNIEGKRKADTERVLKIAQSL